MFRSTHKPKRFTDCLALVEKEQMIEEKTKSLTDPQGKLQQLQLSSSGNASELTDLKAQLDSKYATLLEVRSTQFPVAGFKSVPKGL
jgi:hypothetical protein